MLCHLNLCVDPKHVVLFLLVISDGAVLHTFFLMWSREKKTIVMLTLTSLNTLSCLNMSRDVHTKGCLSLPHLRSAVTIDSFLPACATELLSDIRPCDHRDIVALG